MDVAMNVAMNVPMNVPMNVHPPMYELLNDSGEIKFKKMKMQGSPLPLPTTAYLPTRPVTCHHRHYAYNRWFKMHTKFIDWLADEFAAHAYDVNQDVNKVYINYPLLKKMLSERVYRSSYNKEKSYAQLI